MKEAIASGAELCPTLFALLACALGGHIHAAVELGAPEGRKLGTDGWIILQDHRQNSDDTGTTGFRMTAGTTPSLFAGCAEKTRPFLSFLQVRG